MKARQRRGGGQRKAEGQHRDKTDEITDTDVKLVNRVIHALRKRFPNLRIEVGRWE